MPQYVYQVPASLDEAWQISLNYWHNAYSCAIAQTRDTVNGGRYMLVDKKFDISGVFGFKISLQFDPTPQGVQVVVEAKARGAQLSQFGRLVKDWCRALAIPDQGVLGKSIGQSFKVVGILCIVLIIILGALFLFSGLI